MPRAGRAAYGRLLGLSLLVACALGWGSTPAPRFAVVPAANKQVGQGQVEGLQAEAEKESFLDKLLGTNCFSRALKELNADCRSMGQEQKSRLALSLVNCQQATHGGQAFPCARARPLKECVEGLPDRAWSLYVEFLTHADNMCLFIQNQNFERYTEEMLGKLAAGGAYARGQLDALGAATQAVGRTAADVLATTQSAAHAAEAQLAVGREALELGQKLRSEAAAYFSSLDHKQQRALEGQEESLRRQTELQAGQRAALAAIARGREAVEGAFGAMEERAAALAAAQREHEAAQRAVTAELRSLADDSRGLRSAVDVVLTYQQRSDAVLVQLMGKSYSMEDVLFYGAGAAVALAAGAARATAGARLPVLAVLTVSMASERLLLSHLHLFLEVGPTGEVMLSLPLPWWVPLGRPLLTFGFKWAVRRAAVALGAVLMLWAFFAHKNYEKETFRLLVSMEAEQRRRDEQYRLLMQQHNLSVIRQVQAAAAGAPAAGSGARGKGRALAQPAEAAPLLWEGEAGSLQPSYDAASEEAAPAQGRAAAPLMLPDRPRAKPASRPQESAPVYAAAPSARPPAAARAARESPETPAARQGDVKRPKTGGQKEALAPAQPEKAAARGKGRSRKVEAPPEDPATPKRRRRQ